jgi:hypothetical protein
LVLVICEKKKLHSFPDLDYESLDVVRKARNPYLLLQELPIQEPTPVPAPSNQAPKSPDTLFLAIPTSNSFKPLEVEMDNPPPQAQEEKK